MTWTKKQVLDAKSGIKNRLREIERLDSVGLLKETERVILELEGEGVVTVNPPIHPEECILFLVRDCLDRAIPDSWCK